MPAGGADSLDGRVLRYLDEVRTRLSPETWRTYSRVLRDYVRFSADNHLAEDETAVPRYLADLEARRLNPATQNTYRSILRSFLSTACQVDPDRLVPKLPVSSKSIRFGGNREQLIQQLLQTATDDSIIGRRDTAMVLMVACGARAADLARARIADLTQLPQRGWVLKLHQGNRNSFVSVPEEVMAAVRLYLDQRPMHTAEDYLFLSYGPRSSGAQPDAHTIRERVRRRLKQSGLYRLGLTPDRLARLG